MQQIRIFKSIESEVGEMEREINGWLQESGVKVVNVFGNIAPPDRQQRGDGLNRTRLQPLGYLHGGGVRVRLSEWDL